MYTLFVLSCFVLCSSTISSVQGGEANWLQFRGQHGSNISETTGLPEKWSEQENLVYKIALPGYGSSTPIFHEGKIYLTYYSGYGLGKGNGEREKLSVHLLCLNQADGTTIWDTAYEVSEVERKYEGFIQEHGYCSASPTTDGERVYGFFGTTGVVACDMQGQKLWQTSVGTGTHGFGTGASPIVHAGKVYINASIESDSLYALDAKTGAVQWQAKGVEMSWGTPLIVQAKAGPELVVSMKKIIKAYHPETGEELWNCVGVQDYVCPSVIAHDDVIYTIGGRKSQCIAVRVGGRGDVSESHKLWSADVGSNVPSPVYHAGHLYWVNHQGMYLVVNAKTGEVITKERLPSGGKTYASVLLADGKLFGISRDQGGYVLEASTKLNVISQNVIGDDGTVFNASPVAINHRLYLRSDKYLYCLGK